MSRSFPDGFLWGAATSAYQIEGSPLADGAGPSIWHYFCRTPGRTASGETGDVACDHYRRFRDDVRLMKSLGLQAYRFSVAWGRVLPEGRGSVNQKGLDFYERLVDELLSAGIRPMVTLYHWDLPAALDERGGWMNRDVADWFSEYAAVMFAALDDRVTHWATLNEPWVVMDGGYMHGAHAPGRRSAYDAARVTHNLLRAHTDAVRVYRTMGSNEIGIVVNIEPKYPASSSPEDLAAVARADAYMNRQYLDPLFLGRYPDELKEMLGDAWRSEFDTEARSFPRPLDFVGLNYYTRRVTRHDADAWPEYADGVRQPGSTYTEMGWEVYPDALRDVLLWMTERYGRPPIYITENGAAFYDPPKPVHGEILDPLRVEYFRQHIGAVHEAMSRGADVRGYFAWSLFDNFEWSLGYEKRFGIVHVDFETQQRTPKASARYYSDVIAANGLKD
jgi:beta-glucosidase